MMQNAVLKKATPVSSTFGCFFPLCVCLWASCHSSVASLHDIIIYRLLQLSRPSKGKKVLPSFITYYLLHSSTTAALLAYTYRYLPSTT